ncbi:MAG: tetratricopeptide repeat protein, partial [Clostridia bacterium]|nr:tetratricopeptide repeat protein [Clostridia bacterium]
MGFVRLYCPTCGAGIELDNSREYGFCQYCGTKVVQDKIVVEHRGSVEIDRSSEIRNLLILANELTSQNRIEEAESYYNRVLEYDVNNPTA